MTNSYNEKNRNKNDSVFSKNHGRSVKYRVRVQEELEAETEIKEYKQAIIPVDVDLTEQYKGE